MPGKVNPVMCESLMQVSPRVIGNDQTVAFSGATGGQFQLNIMMPIMGHATIESVELLAQGTTAFVDLCALDMEANPAACEASVEKSLAMVTSLNPHIGYEKAAAMAKEAFRRAKRFGNFAGSKTFKRITAGVGPMEHDGTQGVTEGCGRSREECEMFLASSGRDLLSAGLVCDSASAGMIRPLSPGVCHAAFAVSSISRIHVD
jgi:hypothetical protein